MRVFALLAAALFLCLLAGEAEARYTQKLTVQVYDEQYRPVKGALAYVEYQLNSVAGMGRTKPKATNESGFVDIVFTDYEEIESSTDYTYTVHVKYGNANASSTMIYSDDTPTRVVDFQVPSYYLFVTVRNQNGQPLAARVTVGDETKGVDQVGSAAFQLPSGKHTVKAEYLNSVKSDSVELAQDQGLDMVIGVYALKLTITDDNKKPVVATVELDGNVKGTDSAGVVAFDNILNPAPQILIRYGEASKGLQMDVSAQGSAAITFDLNKPKIKELRALVSPEGVGTISLFVEDPGAAASGIESVAVSYEVDGAEKSVQAYTIGYNAFEAKIPAQLPGKPVRYNVKVSDRDGNTETSSGAYVIKEPSRPDFPPVPPPEQKPQDFVLFAVTPLNAAIYIAVILIVLYGIFYYVSKKKQRELELEQAEKAPRAPPQAPPTQP